MRRSQSCDCANQGDVLFPLDWSEAVTGGGKRAVERVGERRLKEVAGLDRLNLVNRDERCRESDSNAALAIGASDGRRRPDSKIVAPGALGRGLEAEKLLAFAKIRAPYSLGDAFPSAALGCGWTIAGYAVKLYDPLPCTSADGTVAPTDIGFHLDVASTCTVKLPSGKYRMYFSYGKIGTVKLAASSMRARRSAWPIEDGNGERKYMRTSASPDGIADWTQGRAWWDSGEQSTTVDVGKRHFTMKYVGWLDSDDGVDWALTAPQLAPVAGTTCEDVSYLDATPVFSSGSFWAGWHSTVIPSAEAVVTYRDPTVVYLKGYGRYLMFVVRCDGAGRGSSGGDLSYTIAPLAECDTCASGPCVTNPTTDIVFFSCLSPDFQVGVCGPFRAISLTADSAVGQWFGVPQALLTPDGDYVLLHAVRSQGGGGLWVASVNALGTAVGGLERDWAARPGVPYTALDPLAVAAFFLLGDVSITCGIAATKPVDPQFIFSPDGVLNLFYTEAERGDKEGTLRWVSQARAGAPYDAHALAKLTGSPSRREVREVLLAPAIEISAFGGLSGRGSTGRRGSVVRPGAAFDASVGPNSASTGLPAAHPSPWQMFRHLFALGCPPIDVQELSGGPDYTDPIDAPRKLHVASVHDPDVYIAADNTVRLLFYSFNGLIRAWAGPEVWDATLRTCSVPTEFEAVDVHLRPPPEI